MKFLILPVVFMCFIAKIQSQHISNTLRGYYVSADSSNLYSQFTFHGNGKVGMTFDNAPYDYVQFGDTLVVFPDKSIFKFLVKGDSLLGLSYWVKDKFWLLDKDSLIDNKETTISQAKAPLLFRYYVVMAAHSDEGSALDMLLDDDSSSSYKLTFLDSLCDAGLGRACLEEIGYRMINDVPLFTAALEGKPIKSPADTTILQLSEKAHQLGEVDAYAVLAGYYELIGDKVNSDKYLKKAADEGSIKASMVHFFQSIEQETAPTPKKKSIKRTQAKTRK